MWFATCGFLSTRTVAARPSRVRRRSGHSSPTGDFPTVAHIAPNLTPDRGHKAGMTTFMRRLAVTAALILAVLVLLGGVARATEVGYSRTIGVGAMFGDPTGLSAKFWTGNTNAIDLGVGFYGYGLRGGCYRDRPDHEVCDRRYGEWPHQPERRLSVGIEADPGRRGAARLAHRRGRSRVLHRRALRLRLLERGISHASRAWI